MHARADSAGRHRTAAFFVPACAIARGQGFSRGAVMKRGRFLPAPQVVLATRGPGPADRTGPGGSVPQEPEHERDSHGADENVGKGHR